MSRGGFKFGREDGFEIDKGDMPSWLESFADTLDQNGNPKTAVEVARNRETESVADQINAIMGGGIKHSTVEDAVLYYQERTGLATYLKQVNSGLKASASDETLESKELPKLFEDHPEIKFFIDNLVKTRHGNIVIPAITQEISDTYKLEGVNEADINDPALLGYISSLIGEVQGKKNNSESHNIGKGVGIDPEIDDCNSNAFGFADVAK
jgi:hypothetical protein